MNDENDNNTHRVKGLAFRPLTICPETNKNNNKKVEIKFKTPWVWQRNYIMKLISNSMMRY